MTFARSCTSQNDPRLKQVSMCEMYKHASLQISKKLDVLMFDSWYFDSQLVSTN